MISNQLMHAVIHAVIHVAVVVVVVNVFHSSDSEQRKLIILHEKYSETKQIAYMRDSC